MDYKFKINDFEGPLDLLLHLIKEAKMDIMDIPIVELTDQYLKFILDMQSIDLTVASEYLVMASELIYLKSKYLLPKNIDDDDTDEYVEAKDNLVNRLLEYQQYKELTSTFKDLEEKRKEVYTKNVSNLKEYSGDYVIINNDISLNDLLEAFKKFLERKKYEEPITTTVTNKGITVEERTRSIKNILKKHKKVEFFDLFDDISKGYVVVTFLSILEMAKNKELLITQENNFDKIYCEGI